MAREHPGVDSDIIASGSGNTRDFVSTFLQSRQARLALFILNQNTSLDTLQNHASLGFGATIDTVERASSVVSQNGQSSTNDHKFGTNVGCVIKIIQGSGALDGRSIFDSWLTNGVRIITNNGYSNTFRIGGMIFPIGDNYEYDIVEFEPNNTEDAFIDVDSNSSTMKDKWDGLILFSHYDDYGETVRDDLDYSTGFVSKSGSHITGQVSTGWKEGDGIASGHPQSIVRNNRGISIARTTAISLEITNENVDGFRAYTRDNNWQAGHAVTAVFIRGLNCHAFTDTSPSTAIAKDIGPIPFRPNSMIGAWTNCPSVNTLQDNTQDAGPFGTSFIDESLQICLSAAIEQGSGTTSTKSWGSEKPVSMPIDDGDNPSSGTPRGIEASTTVIMKSNAVNLNFTLIDLPAGAGERHHAFMAFGEKKAQRSSVVYSQSPSSL